MIYYSDYSLNNKPMIFDTHAHLDDEKFDDVREELLASLPSHGVDKIITCGCDKSSSMKAIELAEKYDYIYSAVGIHPENLKSSGTFSDIEALALNKKCVAIGEIGLDYYWQNDNKQEQIYYFEQQIELAQKFNLPIIVHDREAHEDTLKILQKHRPRGVLHCYSGSVEMANEILKLGMYIGIGGVITFKNSKKAVEVIKSIPLERLLLETDCPYLAPEPFRGKLNNSSLIFNTAQKASELLNIDCNELLLFTNNNACELFKIPFKPVL